MFVIFVLKKKLINMRVQTYPIELSTEHKNEYNIIILNNLYLYLSTNFDIE